MLAALDELDLWWLSVLLFIDRWLMGDWVLSPLCRPTSVLSRLCVSGGRTGDMGGYTWADWVSECSLLSVEGESERKSKMLASFEII